MKGRTTAMQMALSSGRPRRRAVTAVALAALAVTGAAAAPPADAAFSLAECAGNAQIIGRGATFSNAAIRQAFAANFRLDPEGCTAHPQNALPRYNDGFVAGQSTETGSGAGRGALGSGEGGTSPLNTTGQRDVAVRYAGSDEGPASASQTAINVGNPASTADDGKVHVVPVAAGAVTTIVNYPTWDPDGAGALPARACPLPTGYKTSTGVAGQDRLRLANWKLEKMWNGDYLRWGDLLEDLDGAGAASQSIADAFPNVDLGGAAGTADEEANYDGAADGTTGCVNRKVLRMVRQDNSGSTFAYKDFLNNAAQINDQNDADPLTGDGSTRNWKPGLTGNQTDNRRWPNTPGDNGSDTEAAGQDPIFGETAGVSGNNDNICAAAYIAAANTSPVCHASGTGGGALRDVVDKNVGFGYGVLADVRGTNRFQKVNDVEDTKYWLPIAVRDSVTNFVDPTVSATGYQEGQASGGAPCTTQPVNGVPAGADPTLTVGGWDPVSMVWANAGYGICTLTYQLLWDDNHPVYVSGLGQPYADEEAKARVVKDFFTFAVSDAGQAYLNGQDYSPLPEAIQAISVAGVDAIGWDKNATGNTGDDDDTPPAGTGTTPPAGTTPAPAPRPTPVAPPAVVTPSNAFTVPSARTRGNDVLASFRFPGAGRVVVTAKGKYTEKRGVKNRKKGSKSLTVGRATVNVTRAGDVSVKLPMSSAAKKALKRTSKITVTITAVYTPAGGAPRTVTKTLSIKGR